MSPSCDPLLAASVRTSAAHMARSPWAVMRSVGFALYLRELKGRLGGQWWGALWAVGEPLASTAVLLAIYALAKAHRLAGVDTLLFLITGLLPYQLFRSLVLRGMESIDANQGLLGYRQVRPIDTVLSRAAVELTLGTAVTTVALAVVAWLGHSVFPQRPLELLTSSMMLVLFGTSLGLVIATLSAGPLARSRSVVRVAFVPLYLASGVVFPLSALPQGLRETLMLNPLAQLLEGLRAAFFGTTYVPAHNEHAWPVAAWVLLSLPLALGLYRLRRDRLLPT